MRDLQRMTYLLFGQPDVDHITTFGSTVLIYGEYRVSRSAITGTYNISSDGEGNRYTYLQELIRSIKDKNLIKLRDELL